MTNHVTVTWRHDGQVSGSCGCSVRAVLCNEVEVVCTMKLSSKNYPWRSFKFIIEKSKWPGVPQAVFLFFGDDFSLLKRLCLMMRSVRLHMLAGDVSSFVLGLFRSCFNFFQVCTQRL